MAHSDVIKQSKQMINVSEEKTFEISNNIIQRSICSSQTLVRVRSTRAIRVIHKITRPIEFLFMENTHSVATDNLTQDNEF